ncbi:MAG: hypothetical protein GY774_00330 [Planctomycetes bacterium]|nr:hypothetical protein [Planctomycetota bacterium]
MGVESYGEPMNQRMSNYFDRPFDGQELPSVGNIESDVFRFGKVQSRVELSIKADTAITVADGTSITFELFWDKSDTGSFTNSRVISAFEASGADIDIDAGAEIALCTPESDVEHYCKVKITTTGTQTGDLVTGKLYYNA